MAAFLFLALVQAQIDPYLLKIGVPGQVQVSEGLTSTASGKQVSVDDVAKAADGKRFVFVGESHDVAEHHKLQSDVILALVKRGRQVIVGFEMFTFDNQKSLNPWTLGWWTEQEFITNANWKTQWGFPYSLYRPIFEAVRTNRLPMVALNVPRDWVKSVGRKGWAGLDATQQSYLGNGLYLGNTEHKAIFAALLGGHPPTGAAGENMYAAQVLWDEGMAESALRYMDARKGNDKLVMVVAAGIGHTMYGEGINSRIRRRTKEAMVNVSCIVDDKPRFVSKGLGDFVFVSRPQDKETDR